MGDVSIRAVTPSDGPGLARAWEDARAYYAALDPDTFRDPDDTDHGLGQWLVQGLQEDLANDDKLVVVAELDGQPVGFLVARLEPPVESAPRQLLRDLANPRATIDALVVQRQFWSQGVGRALVEAAEGWARAKGGVVIKLDTYYHSPVSVAFYEAFGYERRAIVFLKDL